MKMPVNIAVVDDEPDIGVIYKAMFKEEVKEGICTIEFFNSAQALLDFLYRPNNNLKLHILISDINMPHMSGPVLLEIVKKEFPHIDRYISTTLGTKESRDKSQFSHATGFFEKPVNFSDVKKVLKDKYSTIQLHSGLRSDL